MKGTDFVLAAVNNAAKARATLRPDPRVARSRRRTAPSRRRRAQRWPTAPGGSISAPSTQRATGARRALGPFQIDTAAPGNPALSSTHPSDWSSDRSVVAAWSGATDTASGVLGVLDRTGTRSNGPHLPRHLRLLPRHRRRSGAGGGPAGGAGGRCRALVARHCRVGALRYIWSRAVPRGRVVSQRPRPGIRLRGGAKVALVLSRGSKR